MEQESPPLWRPGSAGAPEASADLVAAYPGLPATYLSYVESNDGAEGSLGVEPGWIQLWPVEEVRRLNAGYEVPTNLPGFLGFGSSGGGELVAFDTRAEPWRVCMVPFVPMNHSEAVEIAADFDRLETQFGRLLPAS